MRTSAQGEAHEPAAGGVAPRGREGAPGDRREDAGGAPLLEASLSDFDPPAPESAAPSSRGGASWREDALLRAIARAPRVEGVAPVPGGPWGDLGRYRIEALLGSGGMGSVYLAHDSWLDRNVALKVLRATVADEGDRGRLLREARVAAKVEHERLVRIYDVGEHQGQPFLAMEYVRGESLREWMTRAPRSAAVVLPVALQLVEALAALHDHGLVHRDLKPENVMLGQGGGLKLLDFGLARRLPRPGDEADSLALSVHGPGAPLVGTPGYMAPEQWLGGPVDARVDLFAVGVILYELVTGRRPFTGATPWEVRTATLGSDALFRPAALFHGDEWVGWPPELATTVARALAREPEDRLPSAGELSLRLTRMLAALSGDVAARWSASGSPSSSPPSPAALSVAMSSVSPVTHPTPEAGLAAPQIFAAAGSVPPRTASRRPSRAAWALGGVSAGALCLAAVAAWAPAGWSRLASPAAAPLPSAPRGMVAIPGGAFTLGRTESELQAECARMGPECPRAQLALEAPPRPQRLAPFFLDVHEVSSQDLAAFLASLGGKVFVEDDSDDHYPRFVHLERPDGFKPVLVDLWPEGSGIVYNERREFAAKAGEERRPARQVTWFGAHLYCASRGKRLPTEAEWERAARGLTDRRFPWGDAAPTCGGVALKQGSWVAFAGGAGPACEAEAARAGGGVPAGGALPRPWVIAAAAQDVTPDGIHDLGGNVSEWVDASFAAGGAAPGPVTPEDVVRHDLPMVVRGGSLGESFLARTTARAHWVGTAAAQDIGFRCAASAPKETGTTYSREDTP